MRPTLNPTKTSTSLGKNSTFVQVVSLLLLLLVLSNPLGPKMAPKWPTMAPTWPQHGPKMPHYGTSWPQASPKMAPRWPLRPTLNTTQPSKSHRKNSLDQRSNGVLDPRNFASQILRLLSFGSSYLRFLRIFDPLGRPDPPPLGFNQSLSWPSAAHLGAILGHLGPSGNVHVRMRTCARRAPQKVRRTKIKFCKIFLELSWAHLGSILAHLGANCRQLGSN